MLLWLSLILLEPKVLEFFLSFLELSRVASRFLWYSRISSPPRVVLSFCEFPRVSCGVLDFYQVFSSYRETPRAFWSFLERLKTFSTFIRLPNVLQHPTGS